MHWAQVHDVISRDVKSEELVTLEQGLSKWWVVTRGQEFGKERL